MKKQSAILLIEVIILIFLLTSTIFASNTINVKDYIEGKFPVIFTIYLSSLDGLDEDEKEFIDLLETLPKEKQTNFAKEVYDDGFSKEILERVMETIVNLETEVEEETIEEPLIMDTGKWICSKKIDPIDDSTVIAFILYSDSGKSIYGEPIRLVLRYRGSDSSSETRLYINWYSYLGRDTTPVTYRFGNEKAKTGYWAISTDNTATFYSSGFFNVLSSKRTINFVGDLIKFDRFVAQVSPYRENPITAVFDVRGIEDAIKQYNDILEWIE